MPKAGGNVPLMTDIKCLMYVRRASRNLPRLSSVHRRKQTAWPMCQSEQFIRKVTRMMAPLLRI